MKIAKGFHKMPHHKDEDDRVNNSDVMIYFWEDRANPSQTGWWFGPKVGGDLVWAFSDQKSDQPPVSGWKLGCIDLANHSSKLI